MGEKKTTNFTKLDIYLLEKKKKKKTLAWNIHNHHAQEKEPHFNSKEKGKRLHLLHVHACVHILNLEEDDKTTLHSFWHSHIQHLTPDIHIRPCHHRHNLKCANQPNLKILTLGCSSKVHGEQPPAKTLGSKAPNNKSCKLLRLIWHFA